MVTRLSLSSVARPGQAQIPRPQPSSRGAERQPRHAAAAPLLLLVLFAAAAAPQGAWGLEAKCLWSLDKKTGGLAKPPKPPRFGLLNFQDVGAAGEIYVMKPEKLFDGLWTSWSSMSLELGLGALKATRVLLARNNLFRTYLPGALTGNLPAASSHPCGPETASTRTADGSCNYPEDPLGGAAGTRMMRNAPLAASFPAAAALLDPNPLLVSERLLRRRGGGDWGAMAAPSLNLLAAAWARFVMHDWFDYGPPDESRPIQVPVPPGDPLAPEWPGGTMPVGSTPVDGTRTPDESSLPPTFINRATHWFDGSQLYGSDAVTAARLREGSGGRLKLVEGPGGEMFLPLSDPLGHGDSGMTSDWWLGLEFLHTLFAREHNAIAARLASSYPTMTDGQLYDKAKMVNAAVMAKVHALEWTPAMMPNMIVNYSMTTNWQGLLAFSSKGAYKTMKRLRPFPNDGLYGFKGGERLDDNVTFAWSEEMASIWRFDTMIPDKIIVRGTDGAPLGNITTEDAVGAGARRMAEQFGWAALAASFGTQRPGRLALNNYPRYLTPFRAAATNATANSSSPLVDAAAAAVLSDRERGVPRYNAFRRLLGLKPLASISEITSDPGARADLEEVYRGDIELVDLMPGFLAESTRPRCSNGTLPETQYHLFPLMVARRVLSSDRFYSQNYSQEAYTQEGLRWVEDATLSRVLLRHIPQLKAAKTGVGDKTVNAFFPWDVVPAAKGKRP